MAATEEDQGEEMVVTRGIDMMGCSLARERQAASQARKCMSNMSRGSGAHGRENRQSRQAPRPQDTMHTTPTTVLEECRKRQCERRVRCARFLKGRGDSSSSKTQIRVVGARVGCEEMTRGIPRRQLDMHPHLAQR